ncbi:MAG TPA: DEAD/DEAH box helicase [Rhodocyclaceae bacterium]|nr:DEAD/DEAH box helicase [Rhodocyclaceae bacterium]
MISTDHPTPGLLWGDYPERTGAALEAGEPVLPVPLRTLWDHATRLLAESPSALLAAFAARRAAFRRMSGPQLVAALRDIRLTLQNDGLQDLHVAAAFAIAGVAYERTLGICIFDTQVIAAEIVLRNQLAEMATGEGKTHAVGLAAAAAALSGIPVHVITANDYLAARDADLLRPMYGLLGLTVGTATAGQAAPERRTAYGCDIVYCTAKELVFDYLRDSLGRSRNPFHQRLSDLTGEAAVPPLLHGLCMAIIDEADSILIDEARVPLILSRPLQNDQELLYLSQSLDIARQLRADVHYRVDAAGHRVDLTEAGTDRVDELVRRFAAIWRNRIHREETICTALAALHLYRRDRHYLVRDGRILIIDETTGRVADGRAWSHGLHQLIELKEGCDTSGAQEIVAQITYQRFFPRYLRLGGLSGTLWESAGELRAIYGLSVRRVPLRCPDRRIAYPSRLFPTSASLWPAVARRVAEVRRSGRPVLVGTASVAESEALSARLAAIGVGHSVLNARNDRHEAEIVAQAGRRGAVTVATNMAGRGTDILLEEGIAELGGLHVICCQLNLARRIDRQLTGRCARQGDPGSVETWLAADAPLFRDIFSRLACRLIGALAASLPDPLVRTLATSAQRLIERRHLLERRRLLEHDRAMDRRLRFGDSPE